MTEDVAPPPPDTKDWTWVIERPCPDCGYDAAQNAAAELPALIQLLTLPWATVLTRDDVRDRPAPQIWSPLEYGCHVRDVATVFTQRTQLMLAEDGPTFANWDQDQAAVDGHYHRADPVRVMDELAAAAQIWADLYRSIGDRSIGAGSDRAGSDRAGAEGENLWERQGFRGDGAPFSVVTLGRYGMHDLAHHLVDVGAARPTDHGTSP